MSIYKSCQGIHPFGSHKLKSNEHDTSPLGNRAERRLDLTREKFCTNEDDNCSSIQHVDAKVQFYPEKLKIVFIFIPVSQTHGIAGCGMS